MDKLTPPQIARLAVYVHRAVTENPPNEDSVTDDTKRAIEKDKCLGLWEWNLKKWVDGESEDNLINNPLPEYRILWEKDRGFIAFLIAYYLFD